MLRQYGQYSILVRALTHAGTTFTYEAKKCSLVILYMYICILSSSFNLSNYFMTCCMLPKMEREVEKSRKKWRFHIFMKHHEASRNAIPLWNFRGETSDAFQLLTNIPIPHQIFWSLKCENPPDKTLWQDVVYNSVHLDSLQSVCLLLLGHVFVPTWVKATGFSHLLPFRGGDAERRVHLIIGLSASVFMLDFRFCPAQTLETAGGCVCVCV